MRRNSSASAYAFAFTSGGKAASSACDADRNRSLRCRCLTLPTSAMSVSARIARTSSRKWDGVVLLDTFLLHAEKPRPPRGEHGLESSARGGTDSENAKRVRGFDRRRLIIA